jgi:hypothetical protein
MSLLSSISATTSSFQLTPRSEGATGKAAPVKQTSAAVDPKLLALQQRDREVRAHEQAHLSASGGLASGGARFSFQQGSDGKQYAIGGEVRIDTSPGKTPQETINKARQIRAAALAPAEPSAQDRAVAAQSGEMEVQARAELATTNNSTQSTTGKRAEQSYGATEAAPTTINIQA